MRDHLRLAVLVDGVYQLKITNVTINGTSGAQAVETLEGLAGKSPGSGRVEIDATWAVEIGGPEVNVWDFTAEGSYHEVQIPVGSKSVISQGWFDSAGFSQSVNAATEMPAKFIGEFKTLQ